MFMSTYNESSVKLVIANYFMYFYLEISNH